MSIHSIAIRFFARGLHTRTAVALLYLNVAKLSLYSFVHCLLLVLVSSWSTDFVAPSDQSFIRHGLRYCRCLSLCVIKSRF